MTCIGQTPCSTHPGKSCNPSKIWPQIIKTFDPKVFIEKIANSRILFSISNLTGYLVTTKKLPGIFRNLEKINLDYYQSLSLLLSLLLSVNKYLLLFRLYSHKDLGSGMPLCRNDLQYDMDSHAFWMELTRETIWHPNKHQEFVYRYSDQELLKKTLTSVKHCTFVSISEDNAGLKIN